MPRPDANDQLVLSVYDRLLEDGPQPTGRTRRGNLADLRNAVRRDLEALLNARPCCLGWPEDLTELEVSSLNYGIPDFASANIGSDADRERFRTEIERSIQRFEPRFKTVAVTLVDGADKADRTLRLRIEATIDAEPAPEPLIFDSVVEPASRTFQVASRHG